MNYCQLESLQSYNINTDTHMGSNQTLFLIDVLLVGRLVWGGLDVCVLYAVYLLLHGYVDGGLIFTHVHVSSIALTSKGHIAGGIHEA